MDSRSPPLLALQNFPTMRPANQVNSPLIQSDNSVHPGLSGMKDVVGRYPASYFGNPMQVMLALLGIISVPCTTKG